MSAPLLVSGGSTSSLTPRDSVSNGTYGDGAGVRNPPLKAPAEVMSDLLALGITKKLAGVLTSQYYRAAVAVSGSVSAESDLGSGVESPDSRSEPVSVSSRSSRRRGRKLSRLRAGVVKADEDGFCYLRAVKLSERLHVASVLGKEPRFLDFGKLVSSASIDFAAARGLSVVQTGCDFGAPAYHLYHEAPSGAEVVCNFEDALLSAAHVYPRLFPHYKGRGVFGESSPLPPVAVLGRLQSHRLLGVVEDDENPGFEGVDEDAEDELPELVSETPVMFGQGSMRVLVVAATLSSGTVSSGPDFDLELSAGRNVLYSASPRFYRFPPGLEFSVELVEDQVLCSECLYVSSSVVVHLSSAAVVSSRGGYPAIFPYVLRPLAGAGMVMATPVGNDCSPWHVVHTSLDLSSVMASHPELIRMRYAHGTTPLGFEVFGLRMREAMSSEARRVVVVDRLEATRIIY